MKLVSRWKIILSTNVVTYLVVEKGVHNIMCLKNKGYAATAYVGHILRVLSCSGGMYMITC